MAGSAPMTEAEPARGEQLVPGPRCPDDLLLDYFCSQDGVFVVPIDHLSRAGMDAPFAGALRARLGLSAAWTQLFDESFRTRWSHTEELASLDSRHWLPPRLQHVAVVTDAEKVRPWFEPLPNSSWLLYASDFDPAGSNREFAAYQFAQAERMGRTQNVLAGVIQNLGWW